MIQQKIKEVPTLVSVIVDIDDTLVDTRKRMQAIWEHVLGRRVPLEDIGSLNLRQIFEKHASEEQKARASEFQRKFYGLLLCEDEVGVELARLDEPIPFASEALRRWGEHCTIVYLTGRPETTRDLTTAALERFGLPSEGVEMAMVALEDWRGGRVNEARKALLTSISARHDVVRVVDDFPGYFTIYRELEIPDRIGLRLSEKYEPEDFIDKGATRVVESWEQLVNDIPELA
jgi:phosphoglycolate phosphatase-like HAD superfamily hydrolase